MQMNSKDTATEDLTMTAPNGNETLPFPELQLRTIRTKDGRTISYSCTTNGDDPPVLFFYPGGGNRRMLVFFAEKFPHLRLICINRPGKGDTSPPHQHGHLDTTVQDAVQVLDSLGIDRVSVLCMCAGTPYAMAFMTQHKELTTGHFIGVSSWVQPADCGYENTKLSHYLATRMPSMILSPMVGTVMGSIDNSLMSFPDKWVKGALRQMLSDSEKALYDKAQTDEDGFSRMMRWMQEEQGGQGRDITVLFSSGVVDYQLFSKNVQSIVLWHGIQDTMVPYAGAEWLEETIPGAALHAIPSGTHQGCSFLLHQSIVDSITWLGQS